MVTASLMILAHAVAVIILSGVYFRRYLVTRPPLGVVNVWDVALLLGGIILMPYLYLTLATWLVVSLLGIGMFSLLYVVWEPVLHRRALIGLITSLLVGTDIGVAWQYGVHSTAFFVVNNGVLLMAVIGITNLWAQAGMRARDVAILAGALTLYDFIFTSQLTFMTDLFNRLATLPFAPMIAWPSDHSGHWLGIGLGDLILATVLPLVMHKAFGRSAGAGAAVFNGSAIALVLMLPVLGLRSTFPVMVVLGPLAVVQYLYWLRRCGVERTTWQYRQAVG
jgi:hypothetical protein